MDSLKAHDGALSAQMENLELELRALLEQTADCTQE